MKYTQHVLVGAFISFDDKFLLMKRSLADDFKPGYWEIPGGGLDFRETPHDGLRREIREECGLDIEVLHPLTITTYLVQREDEEIQKFEVTYFCKTTSPLPSVRLSHEHDDYRWVSFDEVRPYKLTKYMKALIQEIEKRIQGNEYPKPY